MLVWFSLMQMYIMHLTDLMQMYMMRVTDCVAAGKPPRLVSVPTHFYKVVLSESKARLPFASPKVAVGAFVMPNNQIQPDMPLTAFAVPLEMLEDVAGTALLFKHSQKLLWVLSFCSHFCSHKS